MNSVETKFKFLSELFFRRLLFAGRQRGTAPEQLEPINESAERERER